MATFLSPEFQGAWYNLVGEVCEPNAQTVADANYFREQAVYRMVNTLLRRHSAQDDECQRVLAKVLELPELAPAELPWTVTVAELRAVVERVVREILDKAEVYA